MESVRGTGGGWLDDLERIEKQTRIAQRLTDTSTGTAEAADGLIEATVTARGKLTELILDPRVHRALATEELAAQITSAVNDAHQRAQEELHLAFADQLPADDRPDKDDPAFGPFLAELSRLQGKARR